MCKESEVCASVRMKISSIPRFRRRKVNEYGMFSLSLSPERETCIYLFICSLVKFTFPRRFSYERSNTNIQSIRPRPIYKDDKDWIGRRGFDEILFFQEKEREKRRKTNEIDDYGRVVKRNVVNEERRKNSAV